MVAALVSRQFVDMSRVRIEGLLAAFPKLVGAGKQHTYVETENVRYVYQPMEVTSRASEEFWFTRMPEVTGSMQLQSHLEWPWTHSCFAHRLVEDVVQALYLLLVTNKASNILEDLETLRLLAKVVPEYIMTLDEEVRFSSAVAVCSTCNICIESSRCNRSACTHSLMRRDSSRGDPGATPLAWACHGA